MKNIKSTQVRWFAGMLGILVIITAGVAVNHVNMKVGIIIGSAVIVTTPFILWLSILINKQEETVRYNGQGSSKS